VRLPFLSEAAQPARFKTCAWATAQFGSMEVGGAKLADAFAKFGSERSSAVSKIFKTLGNQSSCPELFRFGLVPGT